MKKIFKTGLTAICVMLLASCEYYFDLPDRDDSNKLFIKFISFGEDTTYFNINTCIPTNINDSVKTVKTDLEKLAVTIDERGIKAQSVDKNTWMITERVPSGSVLKVEAKAKGTDAVSGVCKVPQTPVIEKFSIKPSVTNEDIYVADIALGRDVDNNARWGIMCLNDLHRITHNSMPGGNDEYEEHYVESVGIWNKEGNEGLFSALDTEYYTLYMANRNWISIVMDDNGKDGHLRFYFYRNVSGSYSYEQVLNKDGVEYTYPYTVEQTSRYDIYVFRLNDELYHYTAAQEASDNNGLALLGLAPAMFAYTNISGGFGVIGACPNTHTGWFEGK